MNFLSKMERPSLQSITNLNLHRKPELYWSKRGEDSVLHLFKQMAERVPAYRDFLHVHKIQAGKIKTVEDLKRVPVVDKENYLRQYPLADLCWDGELNTRRWTISTTSGSTGEPFYFPREAEQDAQYALTAELYLLNNFNIDQKTTLYINGFAMGAWIGGLFTYQAIHQLAAAGKYHLSTISPGIHKLEIIKAVKNLGDKFDQIIIGGYPPLIKDMIDVAKESGVDWSKYDVGFIFSAEGFSESFRDYITQKASLPNPYSTNLNHYGSVDLGTMAHETPESIYLRRSIFSDRALISRIFPEQYKQPTLAQYIPEMFYFEEEPQHNLIASAWSGLPLVRYDLKDYGGVISRESMLKLLSESRLDLNMGLEDSNISKFTWNLPFVYIYERRDFVVKLYGASIYPESIRKVLLGHKFSSKVTGKCALVINTDQKFNQYLEVNVELKVGREDSKALSREISEVIVAQLLKENSEYRSNYRESPRRQEPRVKLWPYEDATFFSPGGKQRWTV